MTDTCRECGRALGGGYLCDDCDQLEIVEADCSAGWREEMWHQRVAPGRGGE